LPEAERPQVDFEAALLELRASFMAKSTTTLLGSDLKAISLAWLFASLLINGFHLERPPIPHTSDAISAPSQSQDRHAQASIVAIVLLNTNAFVPFLRRVRRRPDYLARPYRPSAQIRSHSNLSLAVDVLLPLSWLQVDFAIESGPICSCGLSSKNLDRFVTWPAFSQLDVDDVDGCDAPAAELARPQKSASRAGS
jgi:hypothetical protein